MATSAASAGHSMCTRASVVTVSSRARPPTVITSYSIHYTKLYDLYQKRYCHSFDLRTGSVVQFVPTLLLTALVATQTETMHIEWDGQFVFALLWLVLVLSVGAISLLNLLIRSGSATKVASLFYLTPPVTALMAWALFGETLSLMAMIGMGIAVTVVWLARRS